MSDPIMNITAVCVSRLPEVFSIRNMPFYCYTEGWKPYQHEMTADRVSYLAERRNKAVENALVLFPKSKHILMIDSYYLGQPGQVESLIDRYVDMTTKSHIAGCILGASTWIFDKTRLRPRNRFYDYWTTPEGSELRLESLEKVGRTLRVRAVGGCYVYPRLVWEQTRYNVPEDLHGCEHNWLCEHSSLPVFLSLSERLWREPIVYSWPKRLRMSLHPGRFLGTKAALSS